MALELMARPRPTTSADCQCHRGDADNDGEEGHDGGRRQYVLRRAKSEHEAAHGPKPGRLEIEPYGKQQQHDADFTDRLHLVDVTREQWHRRMRTKCHPHEQQCDDRAQLELLATATATTVAPIITAAANIK